MGFMDNLNKIIDDANKVMNKSLYDPPRLEVDDVVIESDIPEDEADWENPGQLAYPHNDYARDPGVEEHVVDENALVPGGELPTQALVPNTVRESRVNPEWSVDAPANLLSVYNVVVPVGATQQILQENPYRVKALVAVFGTSGGVYIAPTQGGVANGFFFDVDEVTAGSTSGPLEMPYTGNLYALAVSNQMTVSIMEFIRMP